MNSWMILLNIRSILSKNVEKLCILIDNENLKIEAWLRLQDIYIKDLCIPGYIKIQEILLNKKN